MLNYSLAMICPVEHRETCDAIAKAIGRGPGSFSVPLYLEGQNEPTHYGLHTWASPEFVGQAEAMVAGDLPDLGISGAQEAAQSVVMSAVEYGRPSDTWDVLLNELGLEIHRPDEPA